MPIYVPGKLTLRQTYIGTDDPDAEAYIAAVEAADEAASPGIGPLETATKVAIHGFVKGCKNDGIWSAIKASCILAGARTLAGALVPLVGTAPTNYNFVAADYNRETGLVGDGSTKYLDSNRNNNADPQDSKHISVYLHTATSGASNGTYMGAAGISSGNTRLGTSSSNTLLGYRINISSGSPALGSGTAAATGFIGVSRSSSVLTTLKYSGGIATDSTTSAAPASATLKVFQSDDAGYTDARIAFYSIGESLDLALLDARVTDLINAIGAAIP